MRSTAQAIPERALYRPDSSGRHPTAGWTLTATDPVRMDPSVATTLGNPGDAYYRKCHYFIHHGRFEALTDTVVAPKAAG